MAERPAPLLDVACTVSAAAAAAGVAAPHVYAVLPPTAGALDDAKAPAADTQLRSASVVVDVRTAEALEAAYAWDGVPAVPAAPEALVQAVYAGFRVLPHDVFCARAEEYQVWRRNLVERNVRAAQARAHAVRASGDEAQAHGPPVAETFRAPGARVAAPPQPGAEATRTGPAPPPPGTEATRTEPAPPPGAALLADGTAYPVGTLVALTPTRGVEAAAYRAAFSRLVPNGIDYVDVRTAVHVRCATRDAATRLLAATDPLLVSARRVGGADEAAYWAALPVRVRNQAVRRAQR